jgi:hypothetical protein
MTATLITISIITSFLSGFAKAVMDLSEEGKLKFYKKTYWIKAFSWQNKYKNGDKKQGEKFFGSTRWFVAFTDAWHLFGIIERIGFVITYTSVGYLINMNHWFAFMLFLYPFSMLIFHLFYNSKKLTK